MSKSKKKAENIVSANPQGPVIDNTGEIYTALEELEEAIANYKKLSAFFHNLIKKSVEQVNQMQYQLELLKDEVEGNTLDFQEEPEAKEPAPEQPQPEEKPEPKPQENRADVFKEMDRRNVKSQ